MNDAVDQSSTDHRRRHDSPGSRLQRSARVSPTQVVPRRYVIAR